MIHFLPSELLMMIFEFLDISKFSVSFLNFFTESLLRVNLSCKYIKRNSEDLNLWRKFFLKRFAFSSRWITLYEHNPRVLFNHFIQNTTASSSFRGIYNKRVRN